MWTEYRSVQQEPREVFLMWTESQQLLLLCLQTVSVCWSHLQLPWLELDWFMDMSSRIVHLDLSSNCLVALPSVLPWGLLHLHTLDLSNNLLKELPAVHTSQEVICSRYTPGLPPESPSMSSLLLLKTRLHFRGQKMGLFLFLSPPPSVLCFRLRQVNLSNNQLVTLPSGFLHLNQIQRVSAAKNQLRMLFDIPESKLLF